MAQGRPQIAESIKREVRQRCHFGCVICGLPLYTYEHMLGYANVRRHVAKELTLLCSNHQRDSTNGLLPRDKILEADRRPHNSKFGDSCQYELHFYKSESCAIIVGSNHFASNDMKEGARMIALAMDGIPILAFTKLRDHLYLTVQVFDENGKRILCVENNELKFCPTFWDITMEGRRLSIRDGPRKFVIEIEFRPPNGVVVQRGRFCHKGLELLVSPEQVCYANNCQSVAGSSFSNVETAIGVGEFLSPAVLVFPAVNRGHPNREVAEKWMREVRRLENHQNE